MPYDDLDFWHIRESLIGYIHKESTILKLDDFARNKFEGVFIGYECGEFDNIFPPMFLSAILNFGKFGEKKLDDMLISAYWVTWSNTTFVKSHYRKLKIVQRKIEEAFDFGMLKFSEGSTYKIGLEKRGVDLTSTDSMYIEFRWIRETLEKLHWMIKIHETIGW